MIPKEVIKRIEREAETYAIGINSTETYVDDYSSFKYGATSEYLHQQSEIKKILDACKLILEDWDSRMNGEVEQLKVSGFLEHTIKYWSPSSSLVSSSVINNLRQLISKHSTQTP